MDGDNIMKRQTLICLPTLALLLLTFGCTTESKHPASEADSLQVTKEITITIEADQRILLEGQDVRLDVLEARLVEVIGEETVRIILHVAPTTPMGLVSDVRERIPVEHVAEIRSPLVQS